MAKPVEESLTVTFGDLADIDEDLARADAQALHHHYVLSRPIFERRAAVIAKIPHFWALVFEHAPPEIDQYIEAEDSKIFADCLKSLDVTRFEVDPTKPADDSAQGVKSIKITMEFDPEKNDYFVDRVLEKKFKYQGEYYTSEPVKISWKKGKDVTHGVTDAAYAAWEAEQKADGLDFSQTKEQKALEEAVTKSDEKDFGMKSFFRLFAWRGGKPRKATKRDPADESDAGSDPDELLAMEDYDEDHDEDLAFPGGLSLGLLIAEELWPHALTFFRDAHDDEPGVLEDSGSEDDNEEDDEDDSPNIRGLLTSKRDNKEANGGGPPSKKRKT